jgi:group I intron endonuclease
MNKICGIYKITSPSNKIYIGQSKDIYARWRYSYQSEPLRCQQQRFLFHSLKKHGHHKHKFEIIQICTAEELNTLEKYYIDLFQTFNSKFGLNIKEGGSRPKHSEETKRLISEKAKLQTRSVTTRLKISLALRGEKNGNYKRIISKEQREKIRATLKKYIYTPEHRANISAAGRGKKKSEDHKRKISESNKIAKALKKTNFY